ncbi:MAG: hypothetical protein IJ161_11375 [Bacteroidales bacterium]|nr:hypothetical protein [Bacteroidales bacterium]
MKKIVYNITLAAAIIAAAASCSKNPVLEGVLDDGQTGITLKFSSSTMATKADVEGVDRENYVESLRFFVFPATEGSDGTLTVADDAEYIFTAEYSASSTEWTHNTTGTESWVYSKAMTAEELNTLFPNGAKKAKIFAVANYVDKFGANNDMVAPADKPNKEFPTDVKTWKELHELEVGATFFYDDQTQSFGLRYPHVMQPTKPERVEGDENYVDQGDLFFVMAAEADLVLNITGATKADVSLERLASKVTAVFEYENYLEEKTSGDIMWIPQAEAGETRVYLSNAIERTTLGGPLTRDLVPDSGSAMTKPKGNGTRDIFEYAYNFMNDITTTDDKGNKVAHFYTYPISSKEGDNNQPYLKLVLPWYGYKYYGDKENPKYSADDPNWVLYKQKEVYYKIVLPRETINEPNKIYQFTVKVNIIGSDKEVKIIGEKYIVKDWSKNQEISSNVAFGRYISLDIPKDEYDMYVDEVDIAFVSSGKVVPIIQEIYQWNYSGTTATKDYFMQNNEVTASDDLMRAKGFTKEQIKNWVSIPPKSSYLKISHEMCNDIEVDPISKFDATPYVYVVKLHLEDAEDDTFDRTVTITQYPAMYIVAETNSAYGTDDNYGYVYVNGQQNTSQNNWYRVTGLSGNNSNPNMFVITSTILTNPEMILADPRTTTVQNGYNGGNNNWSPSQNSMYESGDRKLMYYYPTDASTDASKKVSPKFRVASSYGKTRPVSRQNAFQRCASYQEDGYPAGRWRIPTSAEVEYVVNLSANGFMDILFGYPKSEDSDVNYWTASGYITVNNNTETVTSHEGDTSGNVYVRCVYDDWYWTDKASDKTKPIWGDRLR